MINIAVTGACGRMGSKIIKTILEQEDMNVVAAIESPNTPLEGKDVGEVIGIGEIGVEVNGAEKLREVLLNKKPQVLVDFTIAAAAVKTIKTASECGVNLSCWNYRNFRRGNEGNNFSYRKEPGKSGYCS